VILQCHSIRTHSTRPLTKLPDDGAGPFLAILPTADLGVVSHGRTIVEEETFWFYGSMVCLDHVPDFFVTEVVFHDDILYPYVGVRYCTPVASCFIPGLDISIKPCYGAHWHF